VIYITVGTHHQRFDRLLGALGPLADLDRLVVQHGPGPPPPEADVAVPFVSAREAVAYVERARVVVTHAGVGSFLVARRAGHIPVVVPRLHRYGEHVDDHQAELARALERAGELIAVWDVVRLAEAVRAVPPPRRRAPAPPALQVAVRRALDGETVARTLVPGWERLLGTGPAEQADGAATSSRRPERKSGG
jgi:beta-1,4-N-acetylglucosaminyltransferase